MLIVSVSLVSFVVEAVQLALAILKQLQLQGNIIDMNTLFIAASKASTSSDSFLLRILILVILCCWIISVIDAYRIGRRMDAERTSSAGLPGQPLT